MYTREPKLPESLMYMAESLENFPQSFYLQYGRTVSYEWRRKIVARWQVFMMPMTLPLNTQGYIDPDAHKLQQYMPQLQAVLKVNEQDSAFLMRFFRNKDLQMAMKIYKRLCVIGCRRTRPVTKSAVQVAANAYCELRSMGDNSLSQELLQIMSKAHIQALLYTHDKIAGREYEPIIMPDSYDVEDDDEMVKIVQLVKRDEPLGVTIQKDTRTGDMEIARILYGGAAHRSGLIHVGDKVQEINGISVRNKDPTEMVLILSRLSGPVTLKLGPADKGDASIHERSSNTRVKALFDYNPRDDPLIPCQDAGLQFKKGDILHIVSQDDPLWWQARKEGDSSSSAGLIPARLLQERREMARKTPDTEEQTGRQRTRSLSPCRISPRIKRAKKVRKMMYQAVQSGEFDHGEIPTYEEVELFHPRTDVHRPLVLVGPPHVGRNELKRRLIASNPEHYVEVVPYTSRPKRPFEENGREYNFITREEMESGILAQRFVEHGEYRGNLYGIRLDSITSIMKAGKVCVLTPNSQAIKLIRTADLRPYLIYIKPPPMERLKDSRKKHQAMVTLEDGDTRAFIPEDYEDMLILSQKLEETCGHWFDYTIINNYLTVATAELIKIAHSVQNEPHWVPISWLQ